MFGGVLTYSELCALIQTLNLGNSVAHGKLNLLVFRVHGAFLRTQDRVFDWLCLFLCILSILDCVPLIVVAFWDGIPFRVTRSLNLLDASGSPCLGLLLESLVSQFFLFCSWLDLHSVLLFLLLLLLLVLSGLGRLLSLCRLVLL